MKNISRFNPCINEWQNSIYTYNKQHLNSILLEKNKIVYSLLNNYFNSNNLYSSKKDNINITFKNKFLTDTKAWYYNILYTIIFNKNYEYNLIKRKYIYTNTRKKVLINWKNKLILKLNKKLFSTLYLNKLFISLPSIKHTNNSILILIYLYNKNLIYLKNKLKILKVIFKKRKWKMNKRIKKINKKILSNINININKNYKYNLIILKKRLQYSIGKKKINILVKRLLLAKIYLNNNKFSYLNIINLNNILYKIFKKNIKINITNIKYAYLNNNILVDNIIKKLNDRKKGVLRTLKKSLKLIKIAEINPISSFKRDKFTYYMYNSTNIGKYDNYINEYLNDKYKTVLECIKNIHVIGIYLEAKGRLTKRMTASRSVYKLKFKGNLKNVYSSYYNIPSLLSRGLIKSNVNHINKNSKNKNGSYGISSSLNTF
jgi:hypothetical protein